VRRLWTFCLLLACAAAAGAETGAETGPAVPVFTEETASAGLQARFTGDWEQMVGGGIAAFDCNGDRRPDIAIAGGTAPATLWVNESAPGGALRLLRADAGVEVTGVSGLYPLDIDGDGLTDLVLLRVGEDLVLKGKGGCRFERANEAWHFDGGDLWSTAFAATWEAGASWPTLAIGSYIDRTQDAFPWGSCTENRLLRPGPNAGFAKPLPLASQLLRVVDAVQRLEPFGPAGAAGVERPRILQGRAGTALAHPARPAAAPLYRR